MLTKTPRDYTAREVMRALFYRTNSPVLLCGIQSNNNMVRKNKSNNKQNNQNQAQRPAGKRRSRKRRNADRQVMMSPPPAPTLGSVGGQLGTIAGNFLSKIFGLGAYKLKRNNVYGDMLSSQVPVMHSSSESVVFRHREYIADVSSSTTFATTSYSINPGLSSTFPYLCNIAQNFQEYQFNGLVFEFKSTSADALNSTNTALGSVILASQYRGDAPAFVDKQQMLNEMWSIDAKPSCDMLLPIECDPSENPFRIQYVRGGAVPSGQDTKLYDIGKLTVGTYGSQATAVIGELWATYEVVLRKPQLSAGLNLFGEGAHYESTTGVSTSNYFGTTRTQYYDNIGLTFSATSITFPLETQGYYILSMMWVGGSTAVTAPSFSATNASVSVVIDQATSDVAYTLPAGTTSARLPFTLIMYVSDPTKVPVFTFSSGTLPTSVTSYSLQVAQISGAFA